MNSLLWLLGAEVVVFLALASLWFFSNWHRHKQRTAALERLLEKLETATPSRSEHYCQWLETHCGLDQERALLIANAWLEAEKRFWRHFVTWQTQPDPAALIEFPNHLHQCLDDLLESLGRHLQVQEPGSPPDTDEVIVTTGAEPSGEETSNQEGAPPLEENDSKQNQEDKIQIFPDDEGEEILESTAKPEETSPQPADESQ